jgi:[glutamine synthetase] adenylyltransferase / [glutamine synthetase]-adenylyl-L-tyrosine phosphorylase
MQSAVLREAIEASADPKQARHYFDEFKTSGEGALLKNLSAEHARILAVIFSSSPALSESLLLHPEWAGSALDPEFLRHPRQKQGLQREVEKWLGPLLKQSDFSAAYTQLREFKQRETLRIAARDLARFADVVVITQELSDLADVCLESVFRLCWQQLTERFGHPYHLDPEGAWQRTEFCVLGMGKLGGQELNYSSDVDVLFVYSDEGFLFKEAPTKQTQTGKGLGNHQFFKRLAEAFIAEVGRFTPEGPLYRIDLRLRPEGKAGPLARSLSSYENYYAQWGQTWERMMLIKARPVAGHRAMGAEFLETIQPFRYPRSLGEGIFQEIAATKKRLESELERNVKLGRGGIREIEFIVQSLQLLHAGRLPFLQGAQTLPALNKLAQYHILKESEAASLAAAYQFLRDVEHRLQMEHNQQTHTIPTERKARERLARLMGFDSIAAFESAQQQHTRRVREIYDRFFGLETTTPKTGLPRDFSEPAEWKNILTRHAFRDVEKAFRLAQEFVHGPGYVHVSPRTTELGLQLLERFFSLCPARNGRTSKPEIPIQKAIGRARPDSESSGPEALIEARESKWLSDPDRVLARLDSFVSAYGSRAMLYEMWTSKPTLFELLLFLFDRSEFLAEMAIRTPDLVDELELSGRLRRRKSAEETLRDLRHGLADEDQKVWVRRYHQAELMRIGLRDILGLADFEQVVAELTALADACLQYAFEVVARKRKLAHPPFAIIGLGKLGGGELNYGSDLDVIFVADSKARNLSQLQPLAAEIMDLLSSPTELGVVFPTDARLRPDGEKGLLVNTLKAYEEYYRQRAQLWEIQALTRIRPIAGNAKVGEQFKALAATLTDFRNVSQPLTAFTPQWKEVVARMRLRIEKERTPVGKHELAIKTGAGGLMDAEFIAQSLCLEYGWREPNTMRALEKARASGVIPNEQAEALIANYRQLRRVEAILRRWSFVGETLLPDDPAPMYRVAVRCGFPDADAFMRAVHSWREKIRSIYSSLMPVPAAKA